MATTFPRETTEPQLEVTLEVGTHVLELVVEDSAGNLSEPDTVTITVVGLPTITSRNFLDVTSVSFGGVDTEATVESKTRIIATVPVEALLGAVDIIVTTAYGQAISPEPFVVEMPLTIAGIAPGSALLGSAITATISGTGLANATQVAFSDPNIVAAVLTSSNEQIEINLLVTDQAPVGDVFFTVTTPRGQVSSQDFGVYFTVEQPTTMSSIIPTEGVQDSKVQAIISGTGFRWSENDIDIEFDNPDISVGDIVVVSTEEMEIVFTIGADAALGMTAFVLTTPDGSFNSADFDVQFNVIEAQPEMSISRQSVRQPAVQLLKLRFSVRAWKAQAVLLSPIRG